MSIVSELNVTTAQNFMPLVTEQIYTGSPILERIFGIAKEGQFGTGVELSGQNIIETLRVGNVAEEVTTITGAAAATTSDGVTGVTKGAYVVTLGADATDLTAEMANNAQIRIGSTLGQAYRIKSIDSATQLTLLTPYEGETITATTTAFSLAYGKTTTNSSGAYGTSDTFAAADNDTLGGATYNWKMYHTTVALHNKEVEMNKDKGRIIDLVAERLQSATTKLQRDLLTDFYASNTGSGNNMVGLGAFVARTGTVGGIDKSAFAFWQGFANTAASNRALTEPMLNKMYHLTKRYGAGDKATLILTSEGVLEAYESTITSVKSATSSPNFTLNADANVKAVDSGIVDFKYKGIDIIADPNMPTSNTLYFINENYLNWRVLKAFQSDNGWVDLKATSGTDKIQLTINGYGALTSTACCKHGVIDHITEA